MYTRERERRTFSGKRWRRCDENRFVTCVARAETTFRNPVLTFGTESVIRNRAAPTLTPSFSKKKTINNCQSDLTEPNPTELDFYIKQLELFRGRRR